MSKLNEKVKNGFIDVFINACKGFGTFLSEEDLYEEENGYSAEKAAKVMGKKDADMLKSVEEHVDKMGNLIDREIKIGKGTRKETKNFVIETDLVDKVEVSEEKALEDLKMNEREQKQR